MIRAQNKNNGAFQPQTLDIDESIFDKNLKIIDEKNVDDTISGIFPGLAKNASASTAKQYKAERKLLPQEQYPTVQVQLFISWPNLTFDELTNDLAHLSIV